MTMYASAPPLSVMCNQKLGLHDHQQVAIIIYQDSHTQAYELRLPSIGCGPCVEWPDFLYRMPFQANSPQSIHPPQN